MRHQAVETKHMKSPRLISLSGHTLLSEVLAKPYRFTNIGFQEVTAWQAATAPDARFVYGEDETLQYADLRIPAQKAPPNGYPVIVFVHGGAWQSKWNKQHTEPFVEALTQQGFATWDLEFRRIGHLGGGYPGTFTDIAEGADFLKVAAESYPLNLDQVIAVGHSSGGHLALWLAGRHQLPDSSELFRSNPLPLHGVISIAGVNDLELSYELGNRSDVLTLIGADSLSAGKRRFAETNPARLRPLGIPQTLMLGDQDAPWRLKMTGRYAEQSASAGDLTKVVLVPGANHMDVVDARSGFAEGVIFEVRELLNR